MNPDRCAVPRCGRAAIDDAALCASHFDALHPAAATGLSIAWRAFVMTDSIADAAEYSRRLHLALQQLASEVPARPQPAQLRLVK